MENHFALVEKETDSAFGIRFPHIPGHEMIVVLPDICESLAG